MSRKNLLTVLESVLRLRAIVRKAIFIRTTILATSKATPTRGMIRLELLRLDAAPVPLFDQHMRDSRAQAQSLLVRSVASSESRAPVSTIIRMMKRASRLRSQNFPGCKNRRLDFVFAERSPFRLAFVEEGKAIKRIFMILAQMAPNSQPATYAGCRYGDWHTHPSSAPSPFVIRSFQ